MVIKPKDAPVWTLEPHTAAKHALLRHYLDAWFPILASKFSELVFIDGFAGPGVYADGEPGSPLLALSALLDRDDFARFSAKDFRFYFNEMDEERFATLCNELERAKQRRQPWPTNVHLTTSNHNFTELKDRALVNRRADSPTFAFIDPFGYGDLPLSLLAELTQPRRSELFIYFDFNSVQRFATADVVDPQLEVLFGTKDFRNAPPAGSGERKQFVYDLYKRQLHAVCDMDYVQGFEMVNLQGKTSSYLFFCTRHLLGFDKMKSVMWKHAPMGDFRFRDRVAGMDVMLSNHVDTEPLKHALLARFGGGDPVTVEEVENFVTAETIFVKSHLRRTLRPMEDQKLLSASGARKKGTFPEGTRLNFAQPVGSASVSMFDF